MEAKAQQVVGQQLSNPDELTYVRQQLVQTHLTLNDALQKKGVIDAQLKVARKEIESLNRQLECKGSSESDELFALKAQVNVAGGAITMEAVVFFYYSWSSLEPTLKLKRKQRKRRRLEPINCRKICSRCIDVTNSFRRKSSY